MVKQVRIIFAAILVVVLTVAANQAGSKKVDVTTGTKVISVSTMAQTVGEVLEDSKITVGADDLVTPPVGTEVTDNMQIFVEEAFMVNASVDGSPKHLKVTGGTVKSVKDKIEDMVGLETKLLNRQNSDMLVPGMTIELATSYTVTEQAYQEIPFEVVYVENNQLDEGVTNVITEGANGIGISYFEVYYEGDEQISKDLIETRIDKSPVNNVIELGTKKQGIMAGGVKRQIAKTVTMRASAYTTDRGDASPITATGERCRVGLVAVDPNYIPLGTWLYVEGYGEARAADTGGMIKGNAIDLYYDTYSEMTNFGRRSVTVHILK